MKKAAFSLVAVAALGLMGCNGQQDQGARQDGVGTTPATETTPGAVSPAAAGTGTTVPGTVGPGAADPIVTPGAPGAMQNDTLGQTGVGTTPGTTGTTRP